MAHSPKHRKPSVDFRRFFRITLMLSDDARKLMLKLTHLIRGYGIYKIKPKEGDVKSYYAFVEAVHDGWKLAQNLIIEKLVSSTLEIQKLEKLRSELHRQKKVIEKLEVDNNISRYHLENRMLRRFIDSIVWTLLDNEHSTVRRLAVNKRADNFSIKNIMDIKEVIDSYNSCPFTIAIMADLTTFVHHGDVILKTENSLSFVELKSGAKSKEILKHIEILKALDCGIAEAMVTKKLSKADRQQFIRTERQLTRNTELISTLKTLSGNDALTGAKVHIRETTVPWETYSKSLVACHSLIKSGKNYAIDVVDSCLYIGMYTDPEFAFFAFSSWIKSEGCTSEVYNLTDSFNDALARPLASYDLPTDLITDIVEGKIIVVGCLDAKKFYELSQRFYPSLLSLERRPAGSNIEGIDVGKKLIAINGKPGAGKMFMGAGLLIRIRYDFNRPLNLLAQHYAVSKSYYYIPPITT